MTSRSPAYYESTDDEITMRHAKTRRGLLGGGHDDESEDDDSDLSTDDDIDEHRKNHTNVFKVADACETVLIAKYPCHLRETTLPNGDHVFFYCAPVKSRFHPVRQPTTMDYYDELLHQSKLYYVTIVNTHLLEESARNRRTRKRMGLRKRGTADAMAACIETVVFTEKRMMRAFCKDRSMINAFMIWPVVDSKLMYAAFGFSDTIDGETDENARDVPSALNQVAMVELGKRRRGICITCRCYIVKPRNKSVVILAPVEIMVGRTAVHLGYCCAECAWLDSGNDAHPSGKQWRARRRQEKLPPIPTAARKKRPEAGCMCTCAACSECTGGGDTNCCMTDTTTDDDYDDTFTRRPAPMEKETDSGALIIW